MRPKSYGTNRSCCDCKHVFKWIGWDTDPKYYCHVDESERPRCGSARMEESFLTYMSDGNEFHIDAAGSLCLSTMWNHWAEPRRVEPIGTCDDCKTKED